jgi:hypothetical protein
LNRAEARGKDVIKNKAEREARYSDNRTERVKGGLTNVSLELDEASKTSAKEKKRDRVGEVVRLVDEVR